MKVLLISRDIDLKNQLESTGFFKLIQQNDKLTKDIEDSDIIIISDKVITYNELIINIEEYTVSTGSRIYYMISNYNSRQMIENISWICKSKKINVIPPKLTYTQIVEKIIDDIFPGTKKESNTITFFGADSKVGVSMKAQSVAVTLAKNTNAKVGLLNLNGYRGVEYNKDDINLGLDNMKVKLLNKILTKEELLANCITKDNLYVLPGVNSILDIRQYHPEHIEELINLASQCFNIVIIDAGSCKNFDFSGSMTISALNISKHIYFVTTQQKIPYQIYEKTKSQILDILGINAEEFYLVVNKYYKAEGISSPDDLARQYKMVLAAYIPNLDYKGWECEFSNGTLLGNDNDYDHEIEQLSKLIASQVEIMYLETKSKKGLLENIFGKKVRLWS